MRLRRRTLPGGALARRLGCNRCRGPDGVRGRCRSSCRWSCRRRRWCRCLWWRRRRRCAGTLGCRPAGATGQYCKQKKAFCHENFPRLENHAAVMQTPAVVACLSLKLSDRTRYPANPVAGTRRRMLSAGVKLSADVTTFCIGWAAALFRAWCDPRSSPGAYNSQVQNPASIPGRQSDTHLRTVRRTCSGSGRM